MSPTHARLLGCVLGSLLPVLAAAAPARDVSSLVLSTPELSRRVSLTQAAAVGPGIHLVRDEGAVRGRAFGHSVALRVRGERVEGLVGALPARLSPPGEGDAPWLEGTVLGAPVQLRRDARGLTGTVGPCTYELAPSAEGYAGRRSCTGSPWQPVRLTLPAGLLERGSALERVALLVVLGV